MAAVTVVAGLGVAVAGCATSAEWDTWQSRPVHFASGNHAMFSMRNNDTLVRGSRAGLDAARNENWFGRPITVEQAQILER